MRILLGLLILRAVVVALPMNVQKDVELMVGPVVENGMLAEPTTTVYVTASVHEVTLTAQVSSIAQPTGDSSSASSSSSSFSSSSAPSPTASAGDELQVSGAAGITYSPYQKNGQCKTADMVESDIKLLKSFGIIRIYDTDCDVLTSLRTSLADSQKLMVGIWDLAKIPTSVAIIATTFGSDFSQLYAVSVGNELVDTGKASVGDIQTALSSARSQLRAIGYSGPVVSVDTLVAVVANPELCSFSDFIAVNSHPYWDGNVDPAHCGTWLRQQLDHLTEKCGPAKQIMVTETGWPNAGSANGKCTPSPANMRTCINAISSTLGSQSILFSTYNDYWKPPGPYNVEQRWGIFGDPQF